MFNKRTCEAKDMKSYGYVFKLLIMHWINKLWVEP